MTEENVSTTPTTDDLLRLDNSRRGDFQRCPRKYYWVQRRGIVKSIGSTALRYGSVWHDTMDAFYTHIMNYGWAERAGAMQAAVTTMTKSWEEYTARHEVWFDDYRTLQNMGLSFMEYTDKYVYDEGMMEILHPEVPFRIKITPTQDEAFRYRVEPFWFTGRIDLLITLNEQPWQLEQKSTGQQLYIQMQRLNRTAQIIGYTFAGKIIYGGYMPQGTLVSMHHLSARKSTKKEYREAGITVYGKPKIEFERPAQVFTETDLENWKQSFMYTAGQLQRSIRHDIWPMQLDSCYTYGRCPYCDLCEQDRPVEDTILEGYHEEELWDPTRTIDPKFIFDNV